MSTNEKGYSSDIKTPQTKGGNSMDIKELRTLSACTDCVLYVANGEEPGGRNIEANIQRTLGYPSGNVCYDGEEQGFSCRSCECCGSKLGGDRFALVLLVWS